MTHPQRRCNAISDGDRVFMFAMAIKMGQMVRVVVWVGMPCHMVRTIRVQSRVVKQDAWQIVVSNVIVVNTRMRGLVTTSIIIMMVMAAQTKLE